MLLPAQFTILEEVLPDGRVGKYFIDAVSETVSTMVDGKVHDADAPAAPYTAYLLTTANKVRRVSAA